MWWSHRALRLIHDTLRPSGSFHVRLCPPRDTDARVCRTLIYKKLAGAFRQKVVSQTAEVKHYLGVMFYFCSPCPCGSRHFTQSQWTLRNQHLQHNRMIRAQKLQ